MASSAQIKKLKDSSNNTIYPVGHTLGIYTSTGEILDTALGEAIAETSAITAYSLNQLHKVGEVQSVSGQTHGIYTIIFYGELSSASYGGIVVPMPTNSNERYYFKDITFDITGLTNPIPISYSIWNLYNSTELVDSSPTIYRTEDIQNFSLSMNSSKKLTLSFDYPRNSYSFDTKDKLCGKIDLIAAI